MTLEELKELIADDEGETVEVKETTGQRRDACETLCAFLNKDGGTVVFGVSRKGKLSRQLMADTTKRDLFDAFQKFEPAADIEVSYVPVDETHTAIGRQKPPIALFCWFSRNGVWTTPGQLQEKPFFTSAQVYHKAPRQSSASGAAALYFKQNKRHFAPRYSLLDFPFSGDTGGPKTLSNAPYGRLDSL